MSNRNRERNKNGESPTTTTVQMEYYRQLDAEIDGKKASASSFSPASFAIRMQMPLGSRGTQ